MQFGKVSFDKPSGEFMKKILLVDNDRLFLDSLKTNLQKYYHVDTVSCCISALTKMEIEHYDAVIVDYKMSPYDGIELVQRMRFQCIMYPVIMITGHGSLEMMRVALENDVCMVMQKPVNVDKLFYATEEVIRNNRFCISNSMDLIYETLS